MGRYYHTYRGLNVVSVWIDEPDNVGIQCPHAVTFVVDIFENSGNLATNLPAHTGVDATLLPEYLPQADTGFLEVG